MLYRAAVCHLVCPDMSGRTGLSYPHMSQWRPSCWFHLLDSMLTTYKWNSHRQQMKSVDLCHLAAMQGHQKQNVEDSGKGVSGTQKALGSIIRNPCKKRESWTSGRQSRWNVGSSANGVLPLLALQFLSNHHIGCQQSRESCLSWQHLLASFRKHLAIVNEGCTPTSSPCGCQTEPVE